MKATEFEKELERVGLAQKHADEAFAWIHEHGKRGVHDIFYYGKMRPKEKVAWAVLGKEEKRYYMKEAAVLVYLLHAKTKVIWLEPHLLMKNGRPMKLYSLCSGTTTRGYLKN